MASINVSSDVPLYLAYRSVGPSADLIVPAVALNLVALIYLAYRSAGPSADLIVPAVALYLVALVGIVMNATVLVVTVKSNSLRGSANFLMALICLCELVHQIGHTFFLVVVVSGTNFVSLFTADLIMAPMIFALNCGLMAMFCAAFDRLFAVALPFKHSSIFTKYKFPYLLGHLFICVIYAALVQCFVLDYAFENAGNPTTGVVAETLLGPVVTQQTNTRVLRSLIIILSINIGGYLFTSAMYQLLYAFGSTFGPPIRTWQIGFISGILLNAAAGSNSVVLYFNSTEYRCMFKKEFQALKGSFGNKNAVHTIGTIQVRISNPNNNMNNIGLSQQINIYLAYRFAGPSADLIVPAFALYLVALVGIVMNATVLVVTVKSNSLRGSANFLMALICLCELVHQIGHTFFLVVVVSGTNFVITQQTNTRVLRSLIIILSINIGGYLFTSAMYQLLYAFGSTFGPPIRTWQIGFISGILLNAAAGSNSVVLYFNSTEYRCMFKKEFQALKGSFGNKNAVHTIGTIQVRISNPNNNMNNIGLSQQINIYLAYRFAGPSADLIVPAFALYLVALVGIVMNATVLVVTVKSNSLRGSANFLMALICLCELVHQIGHTFFLVVVVSGTNFVSLFTADLIMAPMIFALNCGLMAMFCAAFDRLFAVALPFKHSSIFTKYKFPYLLGHLFICVIYAALVQCFVLDYAFENAGNPTTGVVAETLLGPVGYKFFAGTFIISFCSTCCYMSIFVIIRCKNGVTQQTNTRVLRSLIIILSINIGGYLFTSAMYQLLYAFGSTFGPPIRTWQIGFISGILLNAAAGSNSVVLYFNSTEYRCMFKKEFQALKGSFGNKNAVHTIGTIQVRISNPNNNMNNVRSSQQINLYLAYGSVGPSADLIVPAVALNLVAFVGIVSLRGSANFLMALICLCELVHQIGHTFFLVVVISGTNFVSVLTADLIMAPSIFALNCGLMAMFCAAFDRLFAVALPFNHSSISIKYKFPYLLVHLLTCVIYAALFQYYVLTFAFENAGNPTTGMIADTFISPEFGQKFLIGTTVLSLCSMFCYMAIFVIIRCKNGVSQQTNTRLLRSLIIILSISIGGYFVNLVVYSLLSFFGPIFWSPIRVWQFGFVFGIVLNAAAGSNAIILYINSCPRHRSNSKSRCQSELYQTKPIKCFQSIRPI
ncbi:hypothetical protein niasHS_001083 [Heterodera schachtii]|uniref:G-protein coupled receptors family 1 profile domain-containing protein n=1 Tax=Heterodera schachtii TaxID=97005 RepID=A0ABD2K858_HETSC